MKHFVQYHNTEKMGYECGELEADQFRVVTNKVVRDLPGSTVWLVAGKGSPRRYYLCARFTIDDVGPTAGGEFWHVAIGKRGKHFRPMVAIDGELWFREFLKSQANFSLGLREISPRFVVGLETLAAKATAP